jgi:hypothetical protein
MVLDKEQFMKSTMARVVLLAIMFLSGCAHKHHSPKTVADIKPKEMPMAPVPSPPPVQDEAPRAEAPVETEPKPVAKSIPPRKHVSAAKAAKRRNAKASKRPEPETVSPPPDNKDADHRFPVGLLAFLPLAAAGIWMFAKSKDG